MAVIFFRTVIIFVFLLIFMRLLGKRQLGELELSEFIVSVLVAELATSPLQSIEFPLLHALVPITVLFCCELIVSALTVKSVALRRLICGKPCMLIKNGRIDQEQMKKSRLSLDELMEELRGKNITDLSQVRYAVLEVNGSLSTVLYASEEPLTAAAMGVEVPDKGYGVAVIEDGKLIGKNLAIIGKDETWLYGQILHRGAKSVDEVYLMTVFEDGSIYFDPKRRVKRGG